MEKSDTSGSVSHEIENQTVIGISDELMCQTGTAVSSMFGIPEDLILPINALQHGECCIFRVHKRLRDQNPEAYTPKMVSIGPLHDGKKEPVFMEKHKKRYLAEFCERTGKTWSELTERILKQKERICACYESEAFDNIFTTLAPEAAEEKFVKMILLDSIFIIELFLRIKSGDETDFIIGKPCLHFSIRQDLIMLENQLPYFALDDLYSFAYGNKYRWSCLCANGNPYRSFYALTCWNLQYYIYPPSVKNGNKPKRLSDWFFCLSCFCQKHEEQPPQVFTALFKKFEGEKHKHFTDLVRRFHSYIQPEPKNQKIVGIPYNATKLNDAGVNFKVSPEAWPLNVKFERGTLTMPPFKFEDSEECVFRNLMAFEQCHYPHQAYICNYIDLLDSLIDTENDVDLLVQKGIIYHGLGKNEAMAKLLNNLCLEITYTQCYYSDTASALNTHYENSWNKTMAKLGHVYFNDLWRGTATVAATALLILTVIQTILAFFQTIKLF